MATQQYVPGSTQGGRGRSATWIPIAQRSAKKRVDDYYASQAGRSGECAAYNDFRELIARKDIDAVCIATPDHWHAIITLAALRAGKDVYCEKPLTHNVHEAIEVIRAVDANQRVLQTGSMQRSSKEFRVACELVQNGAIGKLERVECSFGDPGFRAICRRKRWSRAWIGTCGWARGDAALQFRAQPARLAQTLPQLAGLPRIRRRHGHRLGRPSPGHRPVGPGRTSGPVEVLPPEKAGATNAVPNWSMPTASPSSTRTASASTSTARKASPGEPRQVHVQTRRPDDRLLHRQRRGTTKTPPAPPKCRSRNASS
jgi:hypothetical protein